MSAKNDKLETTGLNTLIYSTVIITRWPDTAQPGRSSFPHGRELFTGKLLHGWSATVGGWVHLADVLESIRCDGFWN